jgi:thiol-disulfide isomerase/thioredoxin/DNA-binding beta-propeller fold protein YncE
MPRRIFYALGVVLLMACQAWAQASAASTKGAAAMLYRQGERVRAPELEGGRGWLNTDAPLSLEGLRGKVVLLDFWTYGCVNCMHVIPDLKRLEEKYQKQLVVIGVHSAKFENEKETENIRRIVLRYGIEHPVVNDADFRIWHSYAVQAWPTLVLIDPAGYVVGKASGEGHYDILDKAVGELVEDARKRGTLNEQPLKLALERAKVGDLPLAFPGKILADAQGERLFIADTNHNRVVVARLDGTLLYTIGSGARGSADGGFDKASFHRPQGLALDGDVLYVADTENHLIRRADLKARNVETIAGTGQQSRDYSVGAGPARSTPLSSPWDLQLVGRALYIAMAGPHQIWRLDLTTREVSVFAGTGREARNDGRRLGDFADETVATFAQPSGLAGDGKTLYVADAESNIIRAVALEGETKAEGGKSEDAKMKTASLSSSVEEVRTLAGGDLFEFGDRDGEGDDVRLQHPLGLALDGARLFIADTYNHKIKTLDPRTRKVTTFAGAGRPGQADGERASFYEPGGLSAARGRLYVADTNNHAVRVVDIATKRTTTLVIRGLQPPAQPDMKADEYMADVSAGPNASEFEAPAQRLAVGDDGALVLDVALPAGHHLNTAAPNRYKVLTEEGRYYITFGKPGDVPANATPAHPVGVSHTAKDMRLPLRIDVRGVEPGFVSLRVEVTLYYCREDDTGVCRVKTLLWRVPVQVTNESGAPREITLRAKVE